MHALPGGWRNAATRLGQVNPAGILHSAERTGHTLPDLQGHAGSVCEDAAGTDLVERYDDHVAQGSQQLDRLPGDAPGHRSCGTRISAARSITWRRARTSTSISSVTWDTAWALASRQ